MAGIDAGEWVECPSCGTKVLGKAMIPVLGDGGGVRYICVACARTFIPGPDDPNTPADPLAPADTLAPVPTSPTG
jgi:DNA-directed RNA polymerase subunit RPC12/RpoP